jgi:hypothetical protein
VANASTPPKAENEHLTGPATQESCVSHRQIGCILVDIDGAAMLRISTFEKGIDNQYTFKSNVEARGALIVTTAR